MKYLRKFDTIENVHINVLPNVVLVGDTGRVLYNVTGAVTIQHIDGSLYTLEGWIKNGYSADMANGVAVIEGDAAFVIAKSSIVENIVWASYTGTISGATATTTQSKAESDLAGLANTAAILAYDTSGGVYTCANYEFPNGQKGYMPALGEWMIARRLKNEIDAAMELIEGEALMGYCWSSTQYDSSNAWDLHLTSDLVRYSSRSKTRRIRAFTTLN